MYRQSGFLIQSSFGGGDHLNFEVVVPRPEGGMSHYFRDNQDDALPWHKLADFGGEGVVDSVSLIESDFQIHDNSHYNFELAVLRNAQLEHWARENGGGFAWFGPTPIPDALFLGGACGLCMSGVKDPNVTNVPPFHEDFLIVCPSVAPAVGLWTRSNNRFGQDGGFKWTGDEIVQGGVTTGASLIVGRVGSHDVQLASIAADYGHWVIAACTDDQLVLYRLEGVSPAGGLPPGPPWRWKKYIVAAGFRGQPSIIQSRFGLHQGVPAQSDHYGNYEVVVPIIDGGGLAHFWHDNGVYPLDTDYDDLTRWNGPTIFAAGIQYDEVSLIQSSYSLRGNSGDLELVARRRGMRGFDFWWREDDAPWTWTGPLHVE